MLLLLKSLLEIGVTKGLCSLIELKKAFKELKINVPSHDLDELFREYDDDYDGKVNTLSLIQGIRKGMSKERMQLVLKAYEVIASKVEKVTK